MFDSTKLQQADEELLRLLGLPPQELPQDSDVAARLVTLVMNIEVHSQALRERVRSGVTIHARNLPVIADSTTSEG